MFVSHPSSAFVLGCLGCFGRKMAVFGSKLRKSGKAPPTLRAPEAASGELGAQTLDLGRACHNAKSGQRIVEPEALGQRFWQSGRVKCCLLLACWLVLREEVCQSPSSTSHVGQVPGARSLGG